MQKQNRKRTEQQGRLAPASCEEEDESLCSENDRKLPNGRHHRLVVIVNENRLTYRRVEQKESGARTWENQTNLIIARETRGSGIVCTTMGILVGQARPIG